MKKVTISYLPGMGDFLDEHEFQWYNEGRDIITITCKPDLPIYKVYHRMSKTIVFFGLFESCLQYKQDHKSPYNSVEKIC